MVATEGFQPFMGSRSNVASTSVSAIQSCERTRCISQSPFRSPTCSERLSAKAMNRKPRDHFSCRRFGSILKGGDSLNTRGLAAEVGSRRLPQMPAARCDRETPLSPHGLGRSMWDVVSGAPRGRARVGRRRLQTGRTAYGQGDPETRGSYLVAPMGREPFERVGACQTLACQTAPTALVTHEEMTSR